MADHQQEPQPGPSVWWVRKVGDSSAWHRIKRTQKPMISSIVRPSCCGITFCVAAVAPTPQGRMCGDYGG